MKRRKQKNKIIIIMLKWNFYEKIYITHRYNTYENRETNKNVVIFFFFFRGQSNCTNNIIQNCPLRNRPRIMRKMNRVYVFLCASPIISGLMLAGD